MRRLRAVAAFWYDFIVGDDWRIAAWVVLGLALTGLAAHRLHIAAWWVLPAMVAVGLVMSLRVQAQRSIREAAPTGSSAIEFVAKQ